MLLHHYLNHIILALPIAVHGYDYQKEWWIMERPGPPNYSKIYILKKNLNKVKQIKI